MPVDSKMYRDVFGVNGIRAVNSFYHKYELKREATRENNAAELAQKIKALEDEYAKLDVKDFEYPGMN